jgi:hypothetical protein
MSKSKPAPEPTEPTGAFQILHRGIVLCDTRQEGTRHANPHGYIYKGDVARLSDGRLMARWAYTEPGHEMVWYALWAGPRVDPTTVLPQPPRNPRNVIKDTLTSWQGDVNILEVTREPKDRQEFRGRFPTVAEAIGLGPWEPPKGRRFDPGAVRWKKGRLGHEEIQRYIDDHCAGHWGLAGQFATPFSVWPDEEAFTLHEKPDYIRSSLAVHEGRGVVLSRWILPDALQPFYPKLPYPPNRKTTIDITTCIGPPATETLCVIGYVDP